MRARRGAGADAAPARHAAPRRQPHPERRPPRRRRDPRAQTASGREAAIAVLDRGPGIPPGDIERLKEPFTRRDEARSGRSGAGLGLAIVSRIAKAHGARFDLAAREGGGLVASVAFPVVA
ncbi:MAG: hypothetical protein IPH30_17530 [Betaproteobacteria bacterium]|nr:hypothetical protein [Betaproteobacteria bacterium]